MAGDSGPRAAGRESWMVVGGGDHATRYRGARWGGVPTRSGGGGSDEEDGGGAGVGAATWSDPREEGTEREGRLPSWDGIYLRPFSRRRPWAGVCRRGPALEDGGKCRARAGRRPGDTQRLVRAPSATVCLRLRRLACSPGPSYCLRRASPRRPRPTSLPWAPPSISGPPVLFQPNLRPAARTLPTASPPQAPARRSPPRQPRSTTAAARSALANARDDRGPEPANGPTRASPSPA